LQQTQTLGLGDGFGAVTDVQFAVNLTVLPFDCSDRQNGGFGNVTVAQAIGNQAKDFMLAFRECFYMSWSRGVMRFHREINPYI